MANRSSSSDERSVKVKFRPSPLRLLGNQASDLALHGVLDVPGGVEADGSVVGRADHLTLVIEVCRCDEGLRSAVVSHAHRLVFLRGGGGGGVIADH